MAMNDVNFEIREMALCTIGRLSLVNPAYVMPPLRKTLMQVCVTAIYVLDKFDENFKFNIFCILVFD